jgi:hypothetical protein
MIMEKNLGLSLPNISSPPTKSHPAEHDDKQTRESVWTAEYRAKDSDIHEDR